VSWSPNRLDDTDSSWVEATKRLPLAFAQVREDAWIDRELVEHHRCRKVLMIASGGCTAALLSTVPSIEQLTLVDVNASQLALARLKLWLLENADPRERLELLGHSLLSLRERQERLETILHQLGLPTDVFGPPDLAAEFGPDHLGRYEWVFARLRQELGVHAAALDEVLSLSDPVRQSDRVRPGCPLGDQLDRAFDRAMDLEPLVALFGPNATANRVQPFSRHFAERTRAAFAAGPANSNPYLWQMLAGRFPPGCLFPWLDAARQTVSAELSFQHQTMETALELASAASFDLVHLSNILDWLAPDVAALVLAAAGRVLRPGGHVIIRQLNSRLDIRGLASPFLWLDEESRRWLDADRSFFYRQLHVGRRL